MSLDTANVEEIAARFAARGGQPGLAFGIVADGRLVSSGGLGESVTGGPVPTADTVFRIASMTKSFTAAAVMLLRDEGALQLDDMVERYVPEVQGISLPAEDCPPVTIRHLLTMTGGFPTDDPWGDRQQGMPLPEFAALLADGGVRPCWAPGTRFEYSNLGYAILGRVIAAVAGTGYEAAVRARLLDPLGLTGTGYAAGEFDAAVLAHGYQRHEGSWQELRPDPSGAFAPMGGVFSCVRDLARWVAAFAAAFPARDGADDAHPLSRAGRREMQLPQVAILDGVRTAAVSLARPLSASYGFGLFVEEDAEFGAISYHSGGFPGFGSHMRWHPETGLGVIVLANSTYARAGALGGEMLAVLLRQQRAARQAAQPRRLLLRGPRPASDGPWAETVAARDAVNGLLMKWDDVTADRLFTANVALDQPFDDRRADIETLRERIGEYEPDVARPDEFDSPAHCRWWLTGAGGTAAVQIRMAPLTEPRVQQLIIAVPPPGDSVLGRAIGMLVDIVNRGGDWPDELRAALNTDVVLRQLRLAAAWSGPCGLTAYLAGDGATAVTVELTGPTGRVALTTEVGGPEDMVQRVDVSLLPPG